MMTLEQEQSTILDELANICQRFQVDLHLRFEPNEGVPYTFFRLGDVEWKKDCFEPFTRVEMRELAIRLAARYPDRIYS